jgi:hypothetical protein
MDARLRKLLRDSGVSEEICDRLERGEPSPTDVLRKAHETVENHPALVECRKLVAAIRSDLADIQRADRQRGALVKFVEDTPLNGAAHSGLSGIDTAKGQTR